MARRKSYWKKKKKKNTARHIFTLFKLVLWFVALLGIVAVVLWGVFSYSHSLMKDQERVNIVINSKPVVVASLQMQEQTLYLLPIPSNTYVEVTRGYGSYRVGAVDGLGELEGRESLLAETVSEFLGIPIDGWIKFPKEAVGTTELSPEEMRVRLAAMTSVPVLVQSRVFTNLQAKGIQTNLSSIDLARLWFTIANLREDQIRFGSLTEQGILSDLVLADGSTAFSADPMRVEVIVQELFSEPKVRSELLSVRVLNGTGKPGLGAKVARFVTNMGGNVVEVGNAERSDVQRSYIVTTGLEVKNSYTVKRLAKLLNSSIIDEESENKVSDIVVVIGNDYWKKLYQK